MLVFIHRRCNTGISKCRKNLHGFCPSPLRRLAEDLEAALSPDEMCCRRPRASVKEARHHTLLMLRRLRSNQKHRRSLTLFQRKQQQFRHVCHGHCLGECRGGSSPRVRRGACARTRSARPVRRAGRRPGRPRIRRAGVPRWSDPFCCAPVRAQLRTV